MGEENVVPAVPTPVSEVFDSFLSSISDYTFLTLPDEELDERLHGFLKKAKAKFYKCKKDLDLNDEKSHFLSELSDYEIEILSTLMMVEYIKPTMITSETMKQLLSDKDFKIYSQASHLRELTALHKGLKREARKMITDYTYFDLGEEKQ